MQADGKAADNDTGHPQQISSQQTAKC